MNTAPVAIRPMRRTPGFPGFIHHLAFDLPTAAKEFGASDLLAADTDYRSAHMPDDVTRDHGKRMHYAAYRMRKSRTRANVSNWHRVYLALRDRIVLGNRKLIYQAVRRRMSTSTRADDVIGDCHIVLIQAAAAFNPWMGIRFSTYAYTCIVRALSRMAQRHAADRLSYAVSFDSLPGGEPGAKCDDHSAPASVGLDPFLREEHPLLSDREKAIISRRFSLADHPEPATLEAVGAALGLSKERVRQVQASALEKLRRVLLQPPVAPHHTVPQYRPGSD